MLLVCFITICFIVSSNHIQKRICLYVVCVPRLDPIVRTSHSLSGAYFAVGTGFLEYQFESYEQAAGDLSLSISSERDGSISYTVQLMVET